MWYETGIKPFTNKFFSAEVSSNTVCVKLWLCNERTTTSADCYRAAESPFVMNHIDLSVTATTTVS